MFCCCAEPEGQKDWIATVHKANYQQDLNLDQMTNPVIEEPYQFSRDRQRYTLHSGNYRILGDLCTIDTWQFLGNNQVPTHFHTCALIQTQAGTSGNQVVCWQFIESGVFTVDLGADFQPLQISCGQRHGCAFGHDISGGGSVNIVRCWRRYDVHSL